MIKSILVTGASGFIGGAMVLHFAKNPSYKIIATGRSVCDKFNHLNNVEYIQLDLTKNKKPIQADICIHSAGLADDRASEEEFEKHNVLATQLLIDCLKGCETFVFISSSSVYDFSNSLPKKEDEATLDSGIYIYGRSKLKAEHVVKKASFKSIYLLRPRAVYGKGDKNLQPRIERLIKGRYFIIPGKLSDNSSLTHIKGLVDVADKCIEQSKQGCIAYNICDNKTYSLEKAFIQIARKKMGKQPKLVRLNKSFISVALNVLKTLKIEIALSHQIVKYLKQDSLLDNSKVKGELGVELDYNFEDFIA